MFLDVLKGLALIIGIGASGFLYIVFDMFGAPHSRPKFFFEFWRNR